MKAVCLALSLTFSTAGFAEDSGDIGTINQIAPRSSAAAHEIAEINERLAVLSARLAELEMQTNIAKKQDELNKAKMSPSSVDETFIPSVLEIDGIDGRLRAVLSVQGGKTQSVRTGDKVGAWTVKSIKMDSVTVQKGREVLQLGFGATSINPEQNPGQMTGQFPIQ
jgi:type IV pilus biogenesis protein PilP